MRKKSKTILVIALLVSVIAFGAWVAKTYLGGRNNLVWAFLKKPAFHREWVTLAGNQCQGAPFIFPSGGFVGYLYDDVFQLGKRHTGIDIFSGTNAAEMPVYAPFDGFVTREDGWKSSLIIRIPQDPLQPDRQIWVYLTHMADRNGNGLIDQLFPPGAKDVPVTQGQLLGFQGDYSGNPARPVGVHLHLSIVKDDGNGHYLNETNIKNTIDPSPYFGMDLNAKTQKHEAPKCLVNLGID